MGSDDPIEREVKRRLFNLGRKLKWTPLGSGLVLHLGSTAGWMFALWYYDDPNFNLPTGIITFFICGVISWVLVLISIIKAYLNH